MRARTPVVIAAPEIMHGKAVFGGTRVPVSPLFVYLAAGDPLHVFFADFPGVTRRHVQVALRFGQRALTAHARAARSLRAKRAPGDPGRARRANRRATRV